MRIHPPWPPLRKGGIEIGFVPPYEGGARGGSPGCAQRNREAPLAPGFGGEWFRVGPVGIFGGQRFPDRHV